MRVSYRVEETEAGTIISVFDDIDLANANLLADALFSLIDTRRDIVVDFRGLRYIDSVGLHILLRAGQRAERLGCDVTVVAVRPIRQLVEQIGLGRLMSIVSDIPPSHQSPKAAAAPAAAASVRTETPGRKPGTPGEPKKSTASSRSES
jgi:anti-anti-sigma factor